jgi:hypothetical protein
LNRTFVRQITGGWSAKPGTGPVRDALPLVWPNKSPRSAEILCPVPQGRLMEQLRSARLPSTSTLIAACLALMLSGCGGSDSTSGSSGSSSGSSGSGGSAQRYTLSGTVGGLGTGVGYGLFGQRGLARIVLSNHLPSGSLPDGLSESHPQPPANAYCRHAWSRRRGPRTADSCAWARTPSGAVTRRADCGTTVPKVAAGSAAASNQSPGCRGVRSGVSFR